MLAYPIYLVSSSADYYSSMKDKYPNLYVSLSCFSQDYSEPIQTSKGRKNQENFMLVFI